MAPVILELAMLAVLIWLDTFFFILHYYFPSIVSITDCLLLTPCRAGCRLRHPQMYAPMPTRTIVYVATAAPIICSNMFVMVMLLSLLFKFSRD
jgi:hypothetical protein